MKRSVVVLGLMIIGVSLLLYAGWHNLRERRLAMQQAAASRAVLVPDQVGKQGATADEDSPLPQMRGKAAPAFQLVTLEGKKVSLADYKGRPVLVNFWATWCAPCKVEMPWFEEFRKQYAAQGFEVLGVLADDAPKDDVRKVVDKLGVTYPIVLEGDSKIEKEYKAGDYLPTSYYIDRSGTIVEQTAGLGAKDEVEANIKKIVAAGPAPVTAQNQLPGASTAADSGGAPKAGSQ